MDRLKKSTPWLQEVKTVDECDFILVFCPVVSQAGNDIKAAEKSLHNISATKPAVLVVLHHTFDPECVVSDSSRTAKRENMITYDCLFHEDRGLLQCKRNADVINNIKTQIKTQTKPCTTSESQKQAREFRNAVDMLSENIKQLEDVKIELLIKETELSVNKELIITTELRLVLVGESGSDKTAAKNIIQGREEVNLATTSTATATEQSQSTHASAGRKVIMVDNLDGSSPEIQEVKQCVGPQAFLLVIPVKNSEDKVHNVDETQMSPETMEEIFGKKCWSDTMILFTDSDKLQERQIEEFIQSGDLRTRRLVEKCGNRFHCLNIKDSGDGSQVSELLEKIEKMLNRNKNASEISQMIKDMERERQEKDAPIRQVELKMENKLKAIEENIKKYAEDLKELETRQIVPGNKEMVSKLKEKHELMKEIGENIKEMYGRGAGLEERQFIRVILPENQQPIWISLPNQQTVNSEKDKVLAQLEELFSKTIGEKHENKK
ncbi:hypothetical protein C0J45_20901 [Silurus meridionalis]|nr:hypothetical protein C0J45_20901 [Silurus meridionalis]